MQPTEPTSRQRSPKWLRSGVWLTIVAAGLATLAMILALQQVHLVSRFLEAQTKRRAAQIANDARNLVERGRVELIDAVEERLRTDTDSPWETPGDWPSWTDGVYIWDGRELTALYPPHFAPPGYGEHLRGWVEGEDRRGWPDQQGLFVTNSGRQEGFLFGRIVDAEGGVNTVIARVHLGRLRAMLLGPHILPTDGLEAVPATAVSRAWHQPMFGLTGHWAIQPTEAFRRDQWNAVIWQTVAYLSLAGLALATLMVAMWYLIRLARRDIAMAQMKANFVADVSHELKTPLATIRLFGETLQSGRVSSEEKRQEYYEIITRETVRLTNLIENILDFSRIEAGRKSYTFQPTDVGQAVRETYESYEPQLDHHGFEHHLRINDSLPLVDIDPTAVSQVLLNLMANAVKYSDQERSLVVEVTADTRRNRRGVLISVHDRGIGISPEDREHLFEGFFRASDQRVRERGGAGLGLALVRHIVDAHQGSIHVESRLVRGSTFRVFLPETTRQPETSPESDPISSTDDTLGGAD